MLPLALPLAPRVRNAGAALRPRAYRAPTCRREPDPHHHFTSLTWRDRINPANPFPQNPHSCVAPAVRRHPRFRALALLGRRAQHAAPPSRPGIRETCTKPDARVAFRIERCTQASCRWPGSHAGVITAQLCKYAVPSWGQRAEHLQPGGCIAKKKERAGLRGNAQPDPA